MLKILFSFLISTGSLFSQTHDERIESALLFTEQETLATVDEEDNTIENIFPRYVEISQNGKLINNTDY